MISLRLTVCVCVLFNIGIEAFQAIPWWNQNMRTAATPPPPPPWWNWNMIAAGTPPPPPPWWPYRLTPSLPTPFWYRNIGTLEAKETSPVFDSDGCKPGYKIKLDGMSPGSCCNYNGIPMYCCHGPWNEMKVCS